MSTRPNFFVALPVNDPGVVKAIEKVADGDVFCLHVCGFLQNAVRQPCVGTMGDSTAVR